MRIFISMLGVRNQHILVVDKSMMMMMMMLMMMMTMCMYIYVYIYVYIYIYIHMVRSTFLWPLRLAALKGEIRGGTGIWASDMVFRIFHRQKTSSGLSLGSPYNFKVCSFRFCKRFCYIC